MPTGVQSVGCVVGQLVIAPPTPVKYWPAVRMSLGKGKEEGRAPSLKLGQREWLANLQSPARWMNQPTAQGSRCRVWCGRYDLLG